MRRTAAGATLVELAIVVAVVATTSALALPAMSDLLQRQRASTTANRILAELAHARMQAIRRHRRVTVCPSVDWTSCIGGGDWSSGFMTRALARNGAAGGELLRTLQAADLHTFRLVSGAGRPHVVFLPDGRAAGTNLTLSLCDDDKLLRRVIVSNSGRARVTTPVAGETCPPLQ